MKGDRGKYENKYSWLWYFNSKEHRDTFFDKDGNLKESGKKAMDKLQPAIDKLNKLGTFESDPADWVIL